MSNNNDDESRPKKQKMSIEMSPDSEWPEAWLMAEEVNDQCLENRQDPNVAVDAAHLRKLGIAYWKMDADAYEYPVKAVPWDPKDAMDPRLQALRDERGYSYADIITIHPDHLPEFEKKIAAFFEEHIHDAEEIRYVLGGSGFFDVRDENDKWVRIHVKKGDLMTLPEGVYHRKCRCSSVHLAFVENDPSCSSLNQALPAMKSALFMPCASSRANPCGRPLTAPKKITRLAKSMWPTIWKKRRNTRFV